MHLPMKILFLCLVCGMNIKHPIRKCYFKKEAFILTNNMTGQVCNKGVFLNILHTLKYWSIILWGAMLANQNDVAIQTKGRKFISVV